MNPNLGLPASAAPPSSLYDWTKVLDFKTENRVERAFFFESIFDVWREHEHEHEHIETTCGGNIVSYRGCLV